MKAKLYGALIRPAIMVVGSWDPLVLSHRRIIEQLVAKASLKKRSSLIVLLHPHPAAYLHGLHEWPVYDDVQARILLLSDLGVDATMIVHFRKADLNYGIEKLLEVLLSHAQIDELALYHGQSLGPGDAGSPNTIAKVTACKGIFLSRFDRHRGTNRISLVRKAMQDGRFRTASKLVGHPAYLKRPPSMQVRLAWPSGKYVVAPVDRPLLSIQSSHIKERDLSVMRLASNAGGMATGRWPKRSFEWVAVLSGPADSEKGVSR